MPRPRPPISMPMLLVSCLLAPLLAATRCAQPVVIVAPADGTQVDPSGDVAVEIDFGPAYVATWGVRVLLRRSIDESETLLDLTGVLTWSGSTATAQLGPSELREGRNQLLVQTDRNGDGIFDVGVSSTVSWEPRVDVANADRCDPLDPAHCLYPFPNDHFTVADPTSPTGRRVALQSESIPPNFAGNPFDPTPWNVLDGFSVGPMILAHLPEVDLAASGAVPITDLARSLDADAPIALIDAATGEPQLLWAERDVSGFSPDERSLMLRVGRNLPNGRRYVVVMRNLRDAAGELLEPSRLFRVYRDGIPTYDPAIEARRPALEEIFQVLADAGVPRDDLFLAWDFTTQSVDSIARKMLHMRDDAFAWLEADPSRLVFTVDSVEEPLDGRIFRRVQGSFEVPLYMDGGGAPGSRLVLGPDGLPVRQAEPFVARFRCIIPFAATTGGAAPAIPARPSLYGHGLLGSEGEVSAGNVRDFADEHNLIFCGTRWYGMEENDFPTAINILNDFSLFPQFPERLHQGLLSFLVLGRLMIDPDGFATDPAFQLDGGSLIDPSELFYDGNSQGAVAGGGLAAFAQDYTRAVLGVPGMNYSTLLRRSVDFDDFNLIFRISYQNNLDRSLLISMAEMLWEQTEASGHALHTTADTYRDTPPKKILLHVAFSDFQVAQVTAEVQARSLGAHLRTPAVDPAKPIPDAEPFYDIPPIPAYPFDGSAMVVWDSGNRPAPTENRPPRRLSETDPEWDELLPCPRNYGGDPHECPRRQPAARLQKSEFLRSGGAVVDTCNGSPCLAP